MLKLNAIKSEKIWGYELWIASTHPNGMQDDFYEFCKGDYPLLVKIIQANDTLSIQVHPDDDFAVQLEGKGNRGKTECWYVLDADSDSKLVYGIKPGFSKEVLSKAITENKLEDYLEFVNVKKGDFIYIPAGTVHAIGKGLRLLEVQQSCDLTYRLYDWGRGREVHIEKGLSVIKSEEMIPVSQFPGVFDCKYFTLKTLKTSENESFSYKVPSSSKDFQKPSDVQLLYVISSENAKIKCNDEIHSIKREEIFSLKPGEEIFVNGNAVFMLIIAK